MKKNKKKLLHTLCICGFICVIGIGHGIESQRVAKAAEETAGKTQNLGDFEITDGKLLKYKGQDTIVTVPDGVRCIGEHAFYATSVKELELPDSVEEIENYAIGLGVDKLTVGNGLKKIAEKGIGIGNAYADYFGPKFEDYEVEMDWPEDIKIYGSEDSIAKDYAEKYGMTYNDNVTCKLDEKKLYVFNLSLDNIRIYWDIQPNVDGYYIYKSETADGEYQKIAELKQKYGPQTFYTDKDCEPGKKYYYQVRAYRYDTIHDELLISDTALQTSAVARLMRVGDITRPLVTAETSDSLEIIWTSVPDTQVYTVWRAEKKKGPYKKIKTVKTSVKYNDTDMFDVLNDITYTDKNVVFGKKYYYKIKAVNLSNPAVNGLASEVLGATGGIGETILYLYRQPSGAVKVSYIVGPSVTGIILYRKDKADPNAKNEKIATFKVNEFSSTFYIDKTAEEGKQYTYTIKPYLKKNGKTYYAITASATILQ